MVCLLFGEVLKQIPVWIAVESSNDGRVVFDCGSSLKKGYD